MSNSFDNDNSEEVKDNGSSDGDIHGSNEGIIIRQR